jgi:NAD(P)-dependent dehydrogenase (short-subunit alcohol dehydrogenase family)
MGKLDGRTILITGAAAGLGRAASLRLAADGARLALFDKEPASAVVDAVRDSGVQAQAWQVDVTDEAQIERGMKGVEDTYGHIDVLVNNAGILSPRKPWREWTRAEIQRYLDINFFGYFLVAKAAYLLLKKSDRPRVINIASRTFFMGNPGQLPYVISKGAVQGLTWCLARELGEEGITVNAVMPGMVATEGTMAYNQEDAFNRVMGNQAIKERVTPEDLANLIAFVASDDARMITGQTLICDGGGFMR